MKQALGHFDNPVPVYLLTGFLGSGKTTLLNRMLRTDAPRTAVMVNEFGDVPIDNDLFKVDGTASDLIETSTGCICCEPGNDIVSTLARLSEAMDNGEVSAVDRVVIETTGLADPAPIINQMLMSSHHSIAGRFFALAAVITTLDALKGEETVEERLLAHKQLAFADRVALTKADMLHDDPAGRREALAALVARINPSARILDIQDPLAQPETLLDHGIYAPDGRSMDVLAWLKDESPLAKAFGVQAPSQWLPGNRHSDVYTKSLVIEGSVTSRQVTTFLDILMRAAGDRLLRLKGLISLADDPGRPYLIHIVQGIFHPPQRLQSWPSQDHRTRLVVIADGIDEKALESFLLTLKPKKVRRSKS
ncbi:GTPase, G3E family [Devosia crocina]|uniref:GTPase, G3E family n=1 Tax=Devosia crocina TaxID=429728 RepID=A0A1I7NV39_9HYPH|nr:GTP-binding protein [Devosia crocina]SFV38536.1 GTPase, G3E family [Devosia crocina]